MSTRKVGRHFQFMDDEAGDAASREHNLKTRVLEMEHLIMDLIATHEEMWETVTEDSCSRRCTKEWDSLVAEAEREKK